VISTYADYIRRFVPRTRLKGSYMPGEHHFVAVYLLPKLLRLYPEVPDYVNPDGTKNIIGDIVYYKDGKHHFGIEAKLATIRLTAGEFNAWIRMEDRTKHPNVFLAVGTEGLVLQTWSRFRDVYMELAKNEGRMPRHRLTSGTYGPQLSVNKLVTVLSKSADIAKAEVFPTCEAASPESDEQEARFELELAGVLRPLTGANSA
jgi:hypothetical protein